MAKRKEIHYDSVQRIKQAGQVFTPQCLVETMLDLCGYFGNICSKHVIDNSCGDGVFLCEVVRRYCKYYLNNNDNKIQLKLNLETYIHGIELDEQTYNQCIINLNEVVKEFDLQDISWDINNADALDMKKYNNKIDFVIGNPPYVRVHNLEKLYKKVKSYQFAIGGMTDLYLVFFEIGFNMLNNKGNLCYITPSSWLNSLAATNLRKYIYNNCNLKALVDLGHFQAFKNATTYTLISFFDMNYNSKYFDYYKYDAYTSTCCFNSKLQYSDILINSKFYLSSIDNLRLLNDIKNGIHTQFVKVKNGFATLADDVFISEQFPFDDYVIPIVKASTGKWKKCFFPYYSNAEPIEKDILFANDELAKYLNKNKNKLLKNHTEQEYPTWYLFGRTQALKDVFNNKYSVNAIIKDINSIKLNFVARGSGVYSGLYILTNISYDIIKYVLLSNDFITYLKLLKNYKSGGYYTYNSKDLEQYLNYKITKIVTKINE